MLAQCESVVDASGRPVLLSQGLREELMTCITQMASSGLRTLCLAVRDFADDKPPGFFEEPPADDLTLCCVVGIKAGSPLPHVHTRSEPGTHTVPSTMQEASPSSGCPGRDSNHAPQIWRRAAL